MQSQDTTDQRAAARITAVELRALLASPQVAEAVHRQYAGRTATAPAAAVPEVGAQIRRSSTPRPDHGRLAWTHLGRDRIARTIYVGETIGEAAGAPA